ncbi:LCP family protein [Nocardiopsis sp. RSe5-2]|uniref:LCP family protein n=1 Tax=Nocardiopsis endophytica TaxID=3018445 RepID=A0ABT4UD48_9ACTN|nr:LCP family protein [Nocardiopsis endophytica]MDA2814919.1 LCP family protein [Nocardiopsis endophytica]
MPDDATRPDEGAPSAQAPAPKRRRHLARALGWTAAALALVLAAGAATAYGYYRSLRSDMVQHDLDAALDEEERPEKIGDDVNILFIGSDDREDGNAAYGGKDFVGERSDALMLAHISPDSRVTVVNFPRDSLVDLPECAPYGEAEGTPGYYGMINAALFHGGPPCAVKTVESLTDVRIDHFVHLSFVGFRDMVDAVGGVRMCIPEPMHDERAQLDLEAGEQTLDGEESLAFVRARYEIGNGGDIGRIDRQQMFLGALASEVTEGGVLTDPARLDGLLRSVSEHTATDRDLSLDKLVSLASTLADADMGGIGFYTVPWAQAPGDPNRVVWRQEEAAALFAAIKEDRDPGREAEAEAGEEPGGGPSDPPGAEPSPAPGAEPSSADGRDGTDVVPMSALSDDGTDGETGGGGAGGDPAEDGLQGRDATADPCRDGLGQGTGDDAS